MTAPVIVWFRQDLRLSDHPALTRAAASGAPVIPLYVLDTDDANPWPPGSASRWWLHHALVALDEALRTIGNRLVLRRGAPVEEISRLVAATGADQVYFTRRYEPYEAALERRLADTLKRDGATPRRFGGALLVEPESLRTKSGDPFSVFTPFYKALLEGMPHPQPLPPPERLPAPDEPPPSDDPSDWKLPPTSPDWAGGLRTAWSPGEAGAQTRLETFLAETVAGYRDERDRPDVPGTSRLSPHLHFGEISPRTIWSATGRVIADGRRRPETAAGGRSFLRELVWREFSYYQLHHRPGMPDEPLREAFQRFPWRRDIAARRAWERGQTGYPIVDAGMRELWDTGWMHNRVRMIVASFLAKDLLLPWQEGEAWFWDTLVDADLANNAAGWQWVAGSGADAAPYFRVFNPVLQGEKFDPDGAYVRRWVPEIVDLPNGVIHKPWTASGADLDAANVSLGHSYPAPIVDHAAARTRALAAFETIKNP